MFSILKSIIVVFVLYHVFLYASDMDLTSMFDNIASYMYAASFIIIILSLGALVFFTKDKNKIKAFAFMLAIATTLFAGDVFADNPCYPNQTQSPILSDCDCVMEEGVTNSNSEAHILATCWPCNIFAAIFDVFDALIGGILGFLTTNLLGLVAVGYSIWIVYNVLLQFITFKDRNMGGFFNRIGGMTLKVMIVALLLQNTNAMYDYIFNPIVGLISDYSGAIIDGTSCNVGVGNGRSPLSSGIRVSLTCMIYDIFNELETGLNLGSFIMCAASDKPGWVLDLFSWISGVTIPFFSMMIFGFVVWMCYALLLIIFPLYIFDILFRFCFFAIGLPFVIAFWPFSFLKRYRQTLFLIPLTAALNLGMITILVRIMTDLYAIIMDNTGVTVLLSYCNLGDFDGVLEQVEKMAGWDVIMAAVLIGFITYSIIKLLGTVVSISARLIDYESFNLGAMASAFPIASVLAADVGKVLLATPGNLYQGSKAVATTAGAVASVPAVFAGNVAKGGYNFYREGFVDPNKKRVGEVVDDKISSVKSSLTGFKDSVAGVARKPIDAMTDAVGRTRAEIADTHKNAGVLKDAGMEAFKTKTAGGALLGTGLMAQSAMTKGAALTADAALYAGGKFVDAGVAITGSVFGLTMMTGRKMTDFVIYYPDTLAGKKWKDIDKELEEQRKQAAKEKEEKAALKNNVDNSTISGYGGYSDEGRAPDYQKTVQDERRKEAEQARKEEADAAKQAERDRKQEEDRAKEAEHNRDRGDGE